MHELSVMRNVIDIASEHAAGRPVQRLQLAVGRLSCVMPRALSFCFDSLARGTVLEQAELQIREIDGLALCAGCGVQFDMPVGGARCPCGSLSFSLLAGEELKIVELEFLEEN